MPSETTHLTQARHNETFFDHIDAGLFGDWAVTTLFYAALHYVDAYLATQGVHPKGHVFRDMEVVKYGKTRTIHAHYRRLEDRSSDARYDAASISATEVDTLKTGDFDPLKKVLTT